MNIEKKQEVLSNEEAFLQKIENFIDGFDIKDINDQGLSLIMVSQLGQIHQFH